ncbi:hypothetical protein [Mesorhizobium sp. 1M-11]|uniref:hypothetical protein n=1 Tax=Mesorhizobium sp. 1M-11 TaxID=1529006 RepID=UPI0006C743BE|nr:hypothetical protein [Mesorhizobium sp. 1M-11]
MAVLHLSNSGVAYPDDLKLLKEIYDDICDERGFHCGSPAAEDLARAAMDLFAQGEVDENEIRDSLETYLGRRSAASEMLRERGSGR